MIVEQDQETKKKGSTGRGGDLDDSERVHTAEGVHESKGFENRSQVCHESFEEMGWISARREEETIREKGVI